MNRFNVQYRSSSGVNDTTWKRYPVEFTDTELVFYGKDDAFLFAVKYDDIEHVEQLFQLIYTWHIEFHNKNDPLKGKSKEEIEGIKKTFPLALFNPSLERFDILPSLKDKDRIIQFLKSHGVKVLDSNDKFKEYYTNKYNLQNMDKEREEFLRKNEWVRIIILTSLLISVIGMGIMIVVQLHYILSPVPLGVRLLSIIPLLFIILLVYVCVVTFFQILPKH